tara:strand:- start:250 stop:834 length:585 start_codon:yes stop_codon:yes gene_type:complete
MFNGIIKNTGQIDFILSKKNNCFIKIKSNLKFRRGEIGSSVSCSGVCLTLEDFKKNMIKFYLSKETISKSNFKYLKKGDFINIEKSLKYGNRISGHMIQGHVDTTCKITDIKHVGKSWYINFKLKSKHKKYIVEKGSIGINGVSLTISKIFKNSFQIVVIPKTLELTNLIYLKKNDFVNVEFDILGKYIKNFVK